jgi:hypothetical protein
VVDVGERATAVGTAGATDADATGRPVATGRYKTALLRDIRLIDE